MVDQYPHSIIVTVRTPAIQNEFTGTWTAGTSTNYTFNCRAEQNTKGVKIVGNDGALIDYSYIAYMPLTTVIIPFESDFVLTMGLKTFSGKTKGSYNGQLNSRIWL